MSKLKHHFVPKLYLRLFASDTKKRQIHLYNFAHDKTILSVSLRDQCYKHRFHGETDEVENALEQFEALASPVLQQIVSNSALPPDKSEERITLLLFVALQSLRTSLAAARLNTGVDKLTKQILRHDQTLKDVDFDSVRIGYDNPVLQSLAMTRDFALSISDLEMHLICAKDFQFFITSDNPVFKYNQFYEDVKVFSMIGGLCRGLQIFLPLSPKHILMLYDKTVYKVETRKSNVIYNITEADVTAINLFQTVIAEENLYFNDQSKSMQVVELARKGRKYRKSDVVRVDEIMVTTATKYRTGVMRLYQRTPNLRLRLSFVRLQKKAKQVSIEEKLAPSYRYRKAIRESLSGT
jgi:hypothetical protein